MHYLDSCNLITIVVGFNWPFWRHYYLLMCSIIGLYVLKSSHQTVNVNCHKGKCYRFYSLNFWHVDFYANFIIISSYQLKIYTWTLGKIIKIPWGREMGWKHWQRVKRRWKPFCPIIALEVNKINSKCINPK